MANNTANTNATDLLNSNQAQRGAQEYGRKINLIVFNTDLGNGVDLSQLHIKFSCKRSNSMTPNNADIRVYNLDLETALRIKAEFKRVILQAGYEGNYGVIFQGNIKQVILGRESATDTFIDIVAGDGDNAYNFAIVNQTMNSGVKPSDQIAMLAKTMNDRNVTLGSTPENLPTSQLPRGKVFYGTTRDYLRTIAMTTGNAWSIQDEKINFVPLKSYLKGTVVVLTSKTGLIGTPQQTNEGVNMKCLLNPLISIGGRVQIDNASVEQYKINLAVPNSPANIPAPLTDDGMYFILVAEHNGDTRGVDWYTNMICLRIDPSTNPINSVQIDYGQ